MRNIRQYVEQMLLTNISRCDMGYCDTDNDRQVVLVSCVAGDVRVGCGVVSHYDTSDNDTGHTILWSYW